ncbi:MAG TPA: sugar phosphate nucleotidyltransferase [Roseiflexaceae bacterium]|nr:sugar phosphate nucleotidyltransferase [Roseiflexaceae bacterium]
MRVTKAVITAAGRNQRALPLQRVVDRDGTPKSVLRIVVEEALQAGAEEICVVVCPGDAEPYAAAADEHAGRLRFVEQERPLGYGHAIFRARDFVGDAPFLHLVGDHLWISQGARGCAEQLVEVAEAESCAVSAVQPSRESLLPHYGAVGGRRLPGRQDLYLVETVLEKPTPTEAEQRLVVPGLRAGHYLCFFGMHVLTPGVMQILERHVTAAGNRGGVQLSPALDELSAHERYLALANLGSRYDVGGKYGVLTAQLALALGGVDRDEVLTTLVELLATRRV